MDLAVELGEHVLVGIASHLQAERGGSTRPLEPERLDLDDLHAELSADGAPDRLAPFAGHVEVGGHSPLPRDWKGRFGGEPPEKHDGDRREITYTPGTAQAAS